jgi:hypothetical protein
LQVDPRQRLQHGLDARGAGFPEQQKPGRAMAARAFPSPV